MHFLIEQFYNIDVFSWPIFNSCLFTGLLGTFMFYKWMVQYFLDWDKIEGSNDTQNKMKTRTRKFLLNNHFFTHNYM